MVKNFFLLKNFKNIFSKNKDKKKILKILKEVLNENSQIIKSLGKTYQNSYKKKQLGKYKKSSNFRVIGMGGSALGTQAIYDFLKHKIKKKFIFINDLQKKQKKETKKVFSNLVVSKSGNTIETIVNANILIKKNDKNIFITENKKSYLRILAERLKAEIVDHNNFIGGRYSVLSEVGMLPTELMGLNTNNFKQLNVLIKNKKFFDSLVNNVASIFFLIKKKRYNSVIINYDEKSESLFNWYQQLVAESLGKKKKGILPVISKMPRDNHSVMQYYLEGSQKNLFTFFYVHDDKADKIKNQNILSSYNFLKNKKISNIVYAQKKATENVFNLKKIPFRSFEILRRDEKALGELFCFFILETILLGKILNVNPFDQPAVELIKKETKKILI
ncbi:MAG: glucose-6-phosphate isomerase [Candidatus Pelagibacter sp.]